MRFSGELVDPHISVKMLGFSVGVPRACPECGKGLLEAQLGAMHARDIDVLVSTQIVAKGHDFRRVTLVAAVNPDDALFTSDFRVPERIDLLAT